MSADGDSEKKSYKMLRQCEIRRPSEKGYYFDIVWIPIDLARKGKQIIDSNEEEWTIAETFGAKLMPTFRIKYKEKE